MAFAHKAALIFEPDALIADETMPEVIAGHPGVPEEFIRTLRAAFPSIPVIQRRRR